MKNNEWRSTFAFSRTFDIEGNKLDLALNMDGESEGTKLHYIVLDGLLELRLALAFYKKGWTQPADCVFSEYKEELRRKTATWELWQILMQEYELETEKNPLNLGVELLPPYEDKETGVVFQWLLPETNVISFENILGVGYAHASLEGSVKGIEKFVDMIIAYLVDSTYVSMEAFVKNYSKALEENWNKIPRTEDQFNRYLQPWLDAIAKIS